MSDALTEAVQRALDINWAYLWRLHRGEKRNPTAKVMRKLRVRKAMRMGPKHGYAF